MYRWFDPNHFSRAGSELSRLPVIRWSVSSVLKLCLDGQAAQLFHYAPMDRDPHSHPATLLKDTTRCHQWGSNPGLLYTALPITLRYRCKTLNSRHFNIHIQRSTCNFSLFAVFGFCYLKIGPLSIKATGK